MSNLLPLDQKRSVRRLYRKRFAAIALLAFSALLVAGALLTVSSFTFLKANEIILTAKRDTLAGYETTSIARTLAAAVADVNTRLAIFPESETASPLIADFMNPVLLAKSNSIHLVDFSYARGTKANEAQIKIIGTADSRVSLLAFTDRLKKAGSFSNVNVPITNFIKDENVPFTISATISLK